VTNQPLYCRNAREIAKLLCNSDRRASVARVTEWLREYDDFPREVKAAGRIKGRLRSELRGWLEKHAPELARQKALAIIANPDKTIKPSDLNLAQRIAGSGGASAAVAETAGADGALPLPADGMVASQTQLAHHLQAHFHGRISIFINEPTVQQWRKGMRLRPVNGRKPPPFPARNHKGNHWLLSECVAWVDRWIVPHHPHGGGPQRELDIQQQAIEAKARVEINSAEISNIELETIRGRYVPKDQARNARRGALKVQHAIFRRRLENDLTRQRSEWLRPHLTPETMLAWVEYDTALARGVVDAVEADYQSALGKEPEKETKAEN
jgi:hypothetical protein